MGYRYEKLKDIPPNAAITAEAREALRNRWAAAVGAVSLVPAAVFVLGILLGLGSYAILNALISSDDYLSPSFLCVLILIAAAGGVIRLFQQIYGMVVIHWVLNFLDRKDAAIFQSFWTTLRLFGKLVLAGLLITLIVFGKTLLLIVPGILAALDYSQTIPCLMDDPELGVREALRRSRAITHGHRWQIVRLSFRFLGWGILCIFTLVIGLIWLWPYVVTSGMVFYRSCMPKPGEEGYDKLPPVKRQSCITEKISWALVILFLLLFILGNFADTMNTARKIAAVYTVTENAQ